jgi:hypothetical protein
MDESYADQKNLLSYYIGKNSTPLSIYASHNYPQSHHAVLNNFRADFEDFSHFQDLSTKFAKNGASSSESNLFKSNLNYIRFSKLNTPEHGQGMSQLGASGDVNPFQQN